MDCTVARTLLGRSADTAMGAERGLSADTMNPLLARVEYAVHGAVARRAQQIERELHKGACKPFARVVRAHVGDCHAWCAPTWATATRGARPRGRLPRVVRAHVGDCHAWCAPTWATATRGARPRGRLPRVVRAHVGDCHAWCAPTWAGDCHALGQPPGTFVRHVVAAAACPQLAAAAAAAGALPADVARRASALLADCTAGSVGAYSGAGGLPMVRAAAARRVAARDALPAGAAPVPADVFLGAGASDLVRGVLELLVAHVDGRPPAVMVPVPGYPLFPGLLSQLGLARVEYRLDEARGWTLAAGELRRAMASAARAGLRVRAIVVINPGNPTGQVLSRENIEEVVRIAHEHRLLVLADEVYQENIVAKPFHSFRKVMHCMGPPYCEMPLASFETCSKGWAAECGLRAGYVELCRLPPAVLAAFGAARALQQCPSVLGQCALHCVLSPPTPGEPSYDKFIEEKSATARVLAERTAMAHKAFNSIPGYSCNTIEGSMFAFPRVEIPLLAQEQARQMGVAPDEFYCLQMLEETGICVVPGSGFGQQPGSWHFRTTVLHRRPELQHMLASIRAFHLGFLQRYQHQ